MSNQEQTSLSLSNLNPNQSKSLETSLRSLENAITFNKKSHNDYKKEKIKELEKEYKMCMMTNEYEKAIIVVKKLTFFDNSNAEYFIYLAKLYIKLHDISSAISCYKKCLFLDPQNKIYLKTLEKLLFAKGMINLEEGRVNREIFKQIKDEMSRNHYHYLKAVAFLSVGKKDSAIKELEKILFNDQNHVEALILLGKIYLNEGKYRESSHYLWQVYKINPDYSEIMQYVSIMKLKMNECLEKANENIIKGKTEMGLLWCVKGLNLYPNHPDALLLRSAIYRKMGKFNESLNDLNLASANMLIDNCSEKVLKQISLTYNELGLYLLKQKNFLEASRFLDEAIKFKSNDLAAHFNKGECHLQMKDINNALEEYLICLQINPENNEARARCALIYYKYAVVSFNNKEYEEAIEYLNQAMNYYELSSQFFTLRARCYLMLRKIKNAEDDVHKSLQINPLFKDALELKKIF